MDLCSVMNLKEQCYVTDEWNEMTDEMTGPELTSFTAYVPPAVEINGRNFGPNRTFDGVSDYVKVGGELCEISNVANTKIQCTVPAHVSSANFLEFSIGGVILTANITYCKFPRIFIEFSECIFF